MTIPFRPLSEVKMMLEEANTDVSYAYDDLIFVENAAYLIQFDDEKTSNLKIFFNTELNKQQAEIEADKLKKLAVKRKMTISPKGRFSMQQKEDSEEVEISFFPFGN